MDPDFITVTEYYTGSGEYVTYPFTDKDAGTYYYRARGHNAYGAGAWSNVVSTTVRALVYYYDFSDEMVRPSWPIARTSYWQGDTAGETWTEEHDGTLYIIIDDRWDFTIGTPWQVAPDPPYIIEVRAKIHDPANLVAYGIVFGGNYATPCPAYRDTGCFEHYYRLEAIWDGGSLKVGFKRIDYHEPESSEDRGKGRGPELISYQYVSGDPDGWHTWTFVVKPDGIDIYYDGGLFGSTTDTAYVNEPYFGVYASANEYKPAIGRFDYYYVVPQ